MGIALTDKTDTILGYDKGLILKPSTRGVSMYHYVWAIFVIGASRNYVTGCLAVAFLYQSGPKEGQ